MRRFSKISAAVLTSLFLISCTTEKFRGYNNSYSYKISGSITVEALDVPETPEQQPEQPEKPEQPVEPVEPVQEPTDPDNPENPQNPDTPQEPGTGEPEIHLPELGPATFNLRPEEGQLRLIDRGDGNIYLSFNAMAGNVTLAEATIDGMEITLAPDQEKLVKLEAQSLLADPIKVRWEGQGSIFDNAIVFHLRCQGKQNILGKEMTITDSDLKCVAIKNE